MTLEQQYFIHSICSLHDYNGLFVRCSVQKQEVILSFQPKNLKKLFLGINLGEAYAYNTLYKRYFLL